MTDNIISTDRPLHDAGRQTLQALLARIIPASEAYGVPGADDDAIFTDFLNTGRNHAETLTEAVDILDRLVANVGESVPFTDLDDEAQQRIANEFYHSRLVPARAVLALIAQCYYRDDRVMQALGMEVRPPHPHGYEVDQGDWSLLEPVKARGRIYKEI